MRLILPALLLAATPAVAADTPFFSLANPYFVVLIAFLVFVGVLAYFRVPDLVTRRLDRRATTIRSELDGARALRDEAKELLASYEKKAREAHAQADRIVAAAREDALAAAAAARDELERSIARRLRAAEEQIAAAESDAIRAVRERAVAVAVAAAGDVMAARMTDTRADALIDAGIAEAGARLH